MNTQIASFSITNYLFDYVSMDLSKKGNDNLQLNFNTSGLFYEEQSMFELTFFVTVKSEDKENAFVSIQCKGHFVFHNKISFTDIPDYFYGNCIAILFPYVRSYISIISTQANIKGIILPTLNLSSLQSKLRNNTSKK
ncbi:MAG: protein-export chaperone SecB [Rikenellaceae bacterium]